MHHWKKFVLGNNESLSCVYEKNRLSLFLTAFHYLKDESKANDIVNDVFLKLLEMSISERNNNLSEVNEKLETFLKVLVKNKCLDSIKVDKNRKSILNGITHLFTRSSISYEATDIDFSELAIMLPEQQRIIFEMHVNGYDNQAIADELKISYNTVKNTLSTSKRKLRYLWSKFM